MTPVLPEFLYRVFAPDGRLLYIGVTGNLRARIKVHASSSWWPSGARVTIETYPDRDAVLAAERVAIATERPEVNVALQVSAEQAAARERAVEREARRHAEATERAARRAAVCATVVTAYRAIAAARQRYRQELRDTLAGGVTQAELAEALGRSREQLRQDAMAYERP